MTIPTYPAQVLDLSTWKLVLPTGTQNSPDEVSTASLQTYTGAYCQPLKCVAFKNYAGGDPAPPAPQPGFSHFARSELREMHPDGTPVLWDSTDSGTHTMTVVQRVNHISRLRPVTVFNQIHAEPDYFYLGVVDGRNMAANTQKIYANMYGTNIGTMDPDYRLGNWFQTVVQVHSGVLTVFYNGVQKAQANVADSGLGDSLLGCFFKAGSYGQASTDPSYGGEDPWTYAETEIASISISHT